MVSVRTAPRPADFRPSIWPADWQLWRQDRFNTPGTIYDPAIWVRIGGYGRDAGNIIPCPDGGMRLVVEYIDDGTGNGRPRFAEIFSGVRTVWAGPDEYGRSNRDLQTQVYTPPFMMRFVARFSEFTPHVPKNRIAAWLNQTFTPLHYYGLVDAPDPNISPGIELDGDEYAQDWQNKQEMSLHTRTNPHTAPFSNVSRVLHPSINPATYTNQWYELVYLVHRDHDGHLLCHQAINGIAHTRRLDEEFDPAWVQHLDAGFDLPYMVTIMNMGEPTKADGDFSHLDGISLPAPQHYYDIRSFEVWLPPDDPRLSQGFRSNSPGAPADVLPFWEIAGSIAGNTLTVAIANGVPAADWSVSVTEDDPAPSPPVTASGKIKWIAGTKDHNVPGIDISSLDASKDLKVTVTHGGRRWTVAVKR